MTNTQLIAQFLEISKGKESGECKMCGTHTDCGFKAKDYLKESRFTNCDILKNINSDVICENCAACLKDTSIRRSSFICSEKGLVLLKKNDIETVLFNIAEYVVGPFVVCITKSFKKHNSFRARVNNSTNRYFIREEDDEYIFDVEKLKPMYDIINELYLFFTKDEIKSANYDARKIMQFGACRFFEFEEQIKNFRGSKQFELLLHILNSEKRNEVLKARNKI